MPQPSRLGAIRKAATQEGTYHGEDVVRTRRSRSTAPAASSSSSMTRTAKTKATSPSRPSSLRPMRSTSWPSTARGLICMPMAAERIDRLGIPMMVGRNDDHFGTPFTVSVEARAGVSTGISAADRARTVQVLIDPKTRPEDLVDARPHVPAARPRRRRAGARRPDRGRGRPLQARGPLPGRPLLRDDEGRRHHGAAARPAALRLAAQGQDHQRRPAHRVSKAEGEAGPARHRDRHPNGSRPVARVRVQEHHRPGRARRPRHGRHHRRPSRCWCACTASA